MIKFSAKSRYDAFLYIWDAAIVLRKPVNDQDKLGKPEYVPFVPWSSDKFLDPREDMSELDWQEIQIFHTIRAKGIFISSLFYSNVEHVFMATFMHPSTNMEHVMSELKRLNYKPERIPKSITAVRLWGIKPKENRPLPRSKVLDF